MLSLIIAIRLSVKRAFDGYGRMKKVMWKKGEKEKQILS
jgi:hypothetical protein